VSGWLPALVVLFGVGCARSGVEIQRMPDGSHDITCPGTPLAKCLDNVESVCKGTSFEVLYARDEQKTYGVEQTYVEKHTSRAQVHCLGLHDVPRSDGVAMAAPDASATPGASVTPGASATPGGAPVTAPHGTEAPLHACVPGATQACVGVAACAGGQACLPDGSGYGPCDCGVPASGAPSR
jgi:hypothetical protein